MPLSYWLEALDDPDPNKGNLRYDAILAVGRDPDAIPAFRRRLRIRFRCCVRWPRWS